MQKLLIICGPTATGKTKLALHLAKKLNGELVNADSRQVYKGLDALTGKDRSKEIPIHLYDIVEPGGDFSAAHFVRLAQPAIKDIRKRGKLPIAVGGTGFYLRALTQDVETLYIPPNKKVRKRLSAASVEELQEELQCVDLDKWNAMNPSDQKNPRRLIRAIEVVAAAKRAPRSTPRFDVLWVGLSSPLPLLKKRIARSVAQRFEKAVKEVRQDLPPILGVSALTAFSEGKATKEEAIDIWANDEYKYAKRQLTWFWKEKAINWFDICSPSFEGQVEAVVQEWYTPGSETSHDPH